MGAWIMSSLLHAIVGAFLGALVLRAAVSCVCDTDLEYWQAYFYAVIVGIVEVAVSAVLVLTMSDTFVGHEWLDLTVSLAITLMIGGVIYGFLIQDDRGTGAIGFVKGVVVALTIILFYLSIVGFFAVIGLLF